MENIIHFDKSVNIDDLMIHAIIPIYDTEEVLIIAKQAKFLSRREHKRPPTAEALPPLQCNWFVNNGELINGVNNHPQQWESMQPFTTKDSKYGWYGAYSSKIPKGLINALLHGNDVRVQLRHKSSKVVVKVSDHGLRPKKNPFTVVESLATVFLDSTDVSRKKTLSNFNKNCGSILRRLLPWIEFHLMHGVDQIFINQPIQYEQGGEEWETFWKELLAPYLKSKEVALILFDDQATFPMLNDVGGTIQHASHADIARIWSLWINKGRSVWFGCHDLDEYIVPSKTGYFKKEDESIVKTLKGLAPEYNYIDTKMLMVEAPPKEQILLAGNIAAEIFMPKCQKFFARVDDVNLVWCHGVTNWKSPMKGVQESPFRLNHYRVKTPNGWIPTEAATIRNWDPKSLPNSTEEKLSIDHSTVLNKIKQRYNMEHGVFLRYMQKKYPHLKELAIQNLDGE